MTLDASAPGNEGVTKVEFHLTGGSLNNALIATTLTYYGWLASWNSTTVPDGTTPCRARPTMGRQPGIQSCHLRDGVKLNRVDGRTEQAQDVPRVVVVVGEGGLEPPHPFGHRNLNPARLPIPPLARATGQQ